MDCAYEGGGSMMEYSDVTHSKYGKKQETSQSWAGLETEEATP